MTKIGKILFEMLGVDLLFWLSVYIHVLYKHIMYVYIHTYIHAYIHTYIHAYIHTYIHTYIHSSMYYMIRVSFSMVSLLAMVVTVESNLPLTGIMTIMNVEFAKA